MQTNARICIYPWNSRKFRTRNILSTKLGTHHLQYGNTVPLIPNTFFQDSPACPPPSPHQHQLCGPVGPWCPHFGHRWWKPGDGRTADHHAGGDEGRFAACDKRRVCRSRRAAPGARGIDPQGRRTLRKNVCQSDNGKCLSNRVDSYRAGRKWTWTRPFSPRI